jgi:hypothetical protein
LSKTRQDQDEINKKNFFSRQDQDRTKNFGQDKIKKNLDLVAALIVIKEISFLKCRQKIDCIII